MDRRHITLSIALVLLLALPALADAQQMKHSGLIVGIDRDRGTITLAEVGPWQVVQGATVLTTRTIVVTAATEFALVGRVDDPPSGFPGDFIEERLDPWDLRYEDFVTIDCLHRGARLIALKITVTAPDDLDEP